MTVEVKSTLANAIEYAEDELGRVTDKLKLMRWFQRNVEPLVPVGVELGSSYYDYYSKTSIDLRIPADENRKWVGKNGTAALINKARKAFGVEEFTREVSAYGEYISNSYSGFGTLFDKEDGEPLKVRVNVSLGSQLPPTCKIEWEEKEVTTKQRVGKVVCD